MFTLLTVLITSFTIDRFWRRKMNRYIKRRDQIESAYQDETDLHLE